MQWFRWHRGLTENPKLVLVADEADLTAEQGLLAGPGGEGNRCYGAVTVCDVIAVWAVMLEDAAGNTRWGTCYRSAIYIATALRWEAEDVQRIMDALAKFGFTTPTDDGGHQINKWEQYQYVSDNGESRKTSNAERQKRYRERKKQRNAETVTCCNAVTSTEPPETETETETERRDADDAREPDIPESLDRRDELAVYHETGQRVLDYLQSHGGSGFLSYGCVQPWLKAGFDPDLDIMPTIEMVMSRPRDGPVRSLKYFDQAIANAHKTRTTPAPEGRHNGAASSPNREPTNTEILLDGLAKAAKPRANSGQPGAVSVGVPVQKNEGGAR